MRTSLLLQIARTAAVLLLGLYAGGVLFGVLAPSVMLLPGSAYLPYWQALNADYGRAMPVLLLTTLAFLVLTCILSFLDRRGQRIFILSVVALLLTIATIVLTVTQLEPLNRLANSWTVENLPTEWVDVRARWWTLHIIRTILAVLAFAALLIAQAIDNAAPGPPS